MKLGERLLGLLVLWLFWILKQSIRLKLGPSRGILVSREHARSNCELIRIELIVTFSARTNISYMFFLSLFSFLECDETGETTWVFFRNWVNQPLLKIHTISKEFLSSLGLFLMIFYRQIKGNFCRFISSNLKMTDEKKHQNVLDKLRCLEEFRKPEHKRKTNAQLGIKGSHTVRSRAMCRRDHALAAG